MVLLAIFSLLIFPTAAAQAQAPLPPKSGEGPVVLDLQFPDMVARFQRGSVKDYETEHSGLGYGVKYGGH